MKKYTFIILAFLLIQTSLQAQSIKLLKEDGSEIINDTILVNADNTENTLVAPVYVKNLTGSVLEVMVKKYEVDLVSDCEAYFCWDKCYPNTVFKSSTFLTANPNDTIKLFSGDLNTQGKTGLSKIKYTFYKNKDAADSASVTIYYNVITVGVNDINKINQSISCYPNPVSDILFFKYDRTSNSYGSIYIYDLTGKIVKQKNVAFSEQNVQINVSDLNPGLYLWTVEIDGVPVKSEKLIKR